MKAHRLVRLLCLFAILLMPVAMAKQSHAAAPAAPHHEMASPGHCSDSENGPEDEDRRPDAFGQCLMACAALPAPDAGLPAKAAVLNAMPAGAAADAIRGLAPEAATPPPRPA
jgi:hypothetical protein